MEMELLKNAAQGLFGAAMWFLYRELRKELREVIARHEKEMREIRHQWLNDIRYMAKLPTDLEGSYKIGPDSPVAA